MALQLLLVVLSLLLILLLLLDRRIKIQSIFSKISLLGQSEQELLPGPINRVKLDIVFNQEQLLDTTADDQNQPCSSRGWSPDPLNPCSEVHVLARSATTFLCSIGLVDQRFGPVFQRYLCYANQNRNYFPDRSTEWNWILILTKSNC